MKKIKYTLVAIAFGLVVSGCASGDEEQTTYEKIVDDKVITVATEGTYAPFSYYEDDKLVGYDVEIIEAVAQELGVEVKFVETKWDGIIAGLDASKYDIVANQVGITEEREEKYLFSTPYTYSQGVIIVPEDNTEITSFEDLEGKKSAQTITSNWAKIA
ncbi:transporter substrate-binding domain-containing protein [Breznakia pachnodae]|uniref:ABC-type amino acid transport substrate-binding protein n=1 Tax=Breznakia pachnodae TaxID=265178 RepID=A0ABU0E4G4_9FIRM|nr:ABC-type amino acid transport substrate-binding protein [Breznakia pachnodae]